ncbi:hypothetical protein BJY01DRAFT_224249 [Aspergillus pseudoustus]|uniref:TM7S3/TM198-like domain-containing protein n=1 Tax=Aspergillus pseudoustus TaxID=1810923 RepID=A0ABR4J3I2_9EURO
MRAHFLLVLVACFSPLLLALVVRVPHIERPGYGALLVRQTESNTTEATEGSHDDATPTNATSTATSGNSTSASASPTTVPLLNTSTEDDEEGRQNATSPGTLPLQPKVTPALGVGGFILLITGAVLALIGVRNLWIQVFLSSAFLTSLGVTVLIVYVMSPPVRAAIQGAYLVAIFFTGITFGALAIVFKELSEGLGCLLGGFCTSMWLLSTKSGGLLTATDAKTGFIGAISVGFYAISFSHHTRPYGLIVSTSIAGGTAVSLGIDCYSKAGLKEFWLYLWSLNDDIFPLGTDTYPVTRYIKVELAATVIVAIMGVISQMRLWKVVRDRRAKDEEKRQEEQRQKDEAEAEVVRRLKENNMKERKEWEAKYGDQGTDLSSQDIPELAAGSHVYPSDESEAPKKDEAAEKQSISDSVVSYRCSDCRARGDDGDSDVSGDTKHNETEEQNDKDESDRTTCADRATETDGFGPKALHNAATADDKSSAMTAIVGSETMSIYSKRLSMALSRKASVKSAARPVSESQEALIARNAYAASMQSILDDVRGIDSDCHTIAAESHYQAMLDEEQEPLEAEETTRTEQLRRTEDTTRVEEATKVGKPAKTEDKAAQSGTPQPNTDVAKQQGQPVENQPTTIKIEAPLPEDNKTASVPTGNGKPASAIPLNKGACDETTAQTVVDSRCGDVEEDTSHQNKRGHSDAPVECPAELAGELSSKGLAEAPTSTNSVAKTAKPEEPGMIAHEASPPANGPHNRDLIDQATAESAEGSSPKESGRKEQDKSSCSEQGSPEKRSAIRSPPDAKSPETADVPLVFSPGTEGKQTIPLVRLAPEPKKPEPKRLNAETVEQIPKHTSRVVQTYRMNEWAKHLVAADIPEMEPIQPFEDVPQELAVDKEEIAAPVKVAELMQTPLNAQPPPAVESRGYGKDANEILPLESRTGSQKKKRRSKSPRRLSGLSVGSAHNLAHYSPPAVQPQAGNLATASSITLLTNITSAEPQQEESEKLKSKWKGPPPLIAVREDMMRSRLSSLSLPTDPYLRHSVGHSPTDLAPRYSSTFPIVEDDDNIPLSQRRTMLHQQAPSNALPVVPPPAAAARWNNSGVPSKANSPAVLAAWRESVREDLKERSDPLKLAQPPVAATGPSDRSLSPFGQLGQRNASSTSIGDKIAEGMQRGDMSELHREAMRRMQAKANKSVNQLV